MGLCLEFTTPEYQSATVWCGKKKQTQQDPVKTDQIVKDHEEYKDVEMLKDLEKDKDTNNIPNLSLSVKHVVLSLRKKSH